MEKPAAHDKESTDVHGLDLETTGLSNINEAKLIRKIDWALIPWLSLLYLLSYLDRSAIGNAKVTALGVCVFMVSLRSLSSTT